jgi:plastocyanin
MTLLFMASLLFCQITFTAAGKPFNQSFITHNAIVILGTTQFPLSHTSSHLIMSFPVTSFLPATTTSAISWEQVVRIDPVGAGRTTAGNTLTVCKGDSVSFAWQGSHGVVQSKLAAWNTCDLSAGAYVEKAPISSPGSLTIRMTTAGVRFYYCQSGAHCAMGQKVKIITTNARC